PDRVFDERFIQVERVRADIDEAYTCAAKREGIGRRDERVRRHDHFIAGSDVREHCTHLERPGARMCQERLPRTKLALEPLRAAAGERAAAGKLSPDDCLGDVEQLLSHDEWPIKRNPLVVAHSITLALNRGQFAEASTIWQLARIP